jgi:hypothetical protein
MVGARRGLPLNLQCGSHHRPAAARYRGRDTREWVGAHVGHGQLRSGLPHGPHGHGGEGQDAHQHDTRNPK